MKIEQLTSLLFVLTINSFRISLPLFSIPGLEEYAFFPVWFGFSQLWGASMYHKPPQPPGFLSQNLCSPEAQGEGGEKLLLLEHNMQLNKCSGPEGKELCLGLCSIAQVSEKHFNPLCRPRLDARKRETVPFTVSPTVQSQG